MGHLRIIAAALTATVWTGCAMAQVQPAAPELRACEILAANDSWHIRTLLSTFSGEVLGHSTLEWKQEDFDKVLQAAATCNGYVSRVNGRTVWNKDWQEQITAARNFVMPVIDGFERAARRVRETPRDLLKTPTCPKLLDWRFEPRTFSSNAGQLFGDGLFEMSAKDLRAISQFSADCGNALGIYATAHFQITQERTVSIISHIVEIANTIATAKEDVDKAPHRSTDVVAKIDGTTVPPKLAQERMQIMIRRFNQAAMHGGAMSNDTISELEQGVGNVMNGSDVTTVDQAFAEAIKARISSNIFETNKSSNIFETNKAQ